MSDLGWLGDADAWRLFLEENPGQESAYLEDILNQIQAMRVHAQRDSSTKKESLTNDLNPGGTQPQMNSGAVPMVKLCSSCGNENEVNAETCLKCGQSLIGIPPTSSSLGNPLLNTLGSVKTALLPEEQQSTLPPGQEMPMNNAPNPAMQGDQIPQEEKTNLTDPNSEARMSIANEQASINFSSIENLDDMRDSILQGLAEKYNLPPDTVSTNLSIEATFGDARAVNGELGGQIDTEMLQDVTPEGQSQNSFVPDKPLTEIKKGAKVPLSLIVDKIMKDQQIDKSTALNMMKEAWAGEMPPESFDVMVKGNLKFYLPTEMVGETSQQTDSPFLPPQRPEDIMDQQYNQVPEQSAH